MKTPTIANIGLYSTPHIVRVIFVLANHENGERKTRFALAIMVRAPNPDGSEFYFLYFLHINF